MHFPFLQVNELSQDVPYLLLGAIIIVLAALYYQKILRDRREREIKNHDPRAYTVNDSNYNINRQGIDGHRTATTSEEGAATIVRSFEATGEIPSDKEFHELREELKKDK